MGLVAFNHVSVFSTLDDRSEALYMTPDDIAVLQLGQAVANSWLQLLTAAAGVGSHLIVMTLVVWFFGRL